MKLEIIINLCLFFCQQLFIVKIQGSQLCSYYTMNGNQSLTSCNDACCTSTAPSISTACCSSVSLSILGIPFFIITGICFLGICIIYCRPLWKACLCGHKCPCENRSRVSTPRPAMPPNENPIFVLNNNDLPDYETIAKDSTMKDLTPPPYNFVATHPTDFGIEARVPSAPPQYSSRRNSSAIMNPDVPIV